MQCHARDSFFAFFSFSRNKKHYNARKYRRHMLPNIVTVSDRYDHQFYCIIWFNFVKISTTVSTINPKATHSCKLMITLSLVTAESILSKKRLATFFSHGRFSKPGIRNTIQMASPLFYETPCQKFVFCKM